MLRRTILLRTLHNERNTALLQRSITTEGPPLWSGFSSARNSPMSSTAGQISSDTLSFDRNIANLQKGVDAAKTLQAETSSYIERSAQSFVAHHQSSVAAFVQACQVLATGSQDLFRQAAEANRLAFTETLAGIRAVAGAKTHKDRIELQANLFRTSAIWAVSESSRFARASIDLTESVSAPLTARAIAAAEAMTAPKA